MTVVGAIRGCLTHRLCKHAILPVASHLLEVAVQLANADTLWVDGVDVYTGTLLHSLDVERAASACRTCLHFVFGYDFKRLGKGLRNLRLASHGATDEHEPMSHLDCFVQLNCLELEFIVLLKPFLLQRLDDCALQLLVVLFGLVRSWEQVFDDT